MAEENQELRAAGLKVTVPRLKILQLLEHSEIRHFNLQQIIPLKVEVAWLVCGGFARNKVAIKMAEQVIFKKQADAFLLASLSTWLQAVHVIPA